MIYPISFYNLYTIFYTTLDPTPLYFDYNSSIFFDKNKMILKTYNRKYDRNKIIFYMLLQTEYANDFCANIYWHIFSFHDYNPYSMELF